MKKKCFLENIAKAFIFFHCFQIFRCFCIFISWKFLTFHRTDKPWFYFHTSILLIYFAKALKFSVFCFSYRIACGFINCTALFRSYNINKIWFGRALHCNFFHLAKIVLTRDFYIIIGGLADLTAIFQFFDACIILEY